jgi:hypothetical protein
MHPASRAMPNWCVIECEKSENETDESFLYDYRVANRTVAILTKRMAPACRFPERKKLWIQ